MGQSACKRRVYRGTTSWPEQQYHSQRKEFENSEGSSRVPEGLARGGPLCLPKLKEQLNTQRAELSDYFAKRYLAGELYNGSCYSEDAVGELFTYKYTAPDGTVMVWRHAFDLRAFGLKGPCEDVVTLYHYTDELAFCNVGNLEQTAAQLFASLTDERAHFGEGLYATQHEPAVWGSRLRILLNNYSNKDPFSPTPEEARKRDAEWGNGRKSGHRAAFCIPLIVPCSIAYNIFERPTPDMAERIVKDSAGRERPIELGEDYRGKPTHRNRDVWVIRVETDGSVQHATTDADSVLDVLQLRLQKLRASTGEDLLMADCLFELARRLKGRARYGEAANLYIECLGIWKARLGGDHPQTLTCLHNLAVLLQDQGHLAEAEPLYRLALQKSKARLGEDHPHTLTSLNNLAALLQARGQLAEAELLYRQLLEKCKANLGEDHPQTLCCLNNVAMLLKAQGQLGEAERLYRKVLEKCKANLGEDHPETLCCLNNVARILEAQEQLAEAERLYRDVLEKCKTRLGEDHPKTLGYLGNLVGLLHFQGQLAEAEPLYREALEKCRRLNWGKQHPTTMIFIYKLADLLKSMKKFEEAEKLFREELAACRARHGEHHEETVSSRRNLAKFLQELGKVTEAQELLRLAGQTAQ